MPILQSKYRGTKEYLLVYAELIAAARHRGLLTYQEIAQLMGLPLTGNKMGREVGLMLGEISADEHDNGRPMLSAIVVGVNGKPGDGLFGISKRLGVFDDENEVAREQFVEQERRAVYEMWRTVLDRS